MGFEKLRVYQAAEMLSLRVNKLTARLTGQFQDEIRNLRKCAASVPSNIAEAFGVSHEGYGRMIIHLEIARGSCDETRAALKKLTEDGLFKEQPSVALQILARTVSKMLTSLIEDLRNKS